MFNINKKQSELIEYMYIHGSASSNVLASQLKISKRTVISYVRQINGLYPEADLIVSSNRGYTLDAEVFEKVRGELPELVDNDSSERASLIIRMFLTGYGDKINMYEIGEKLHYSESTIRSTLYKIKNTVKKYDLDIQLSYNSAVLTGPEEGKRELYFSLFQDTIERNLFDFTQLYSMLPQYSSDRIYREFDACLKKYYNGVCDYEEVSLFYRLLIAMDRIAHGHFVTDERSSEFTTSEDVRLGREVAERIGRITGVEFPDMEIMYLVQIFSAISIYGWLESEITPQTLKSDLWPECYQLVESSIDAILETYGVDLRASETDYVAFAMHVRAMIRRMNAGVHIRNPYLKLVRRECVAAYDSAACVAERICKLYSHKIHEDDIADLALCIGHSFEQEFDVGAKMKVLFVLPSYFNIHDNLYDYYSREFANKIQPERTSDLSSYKNIDEIDIIVSTLGLKELNGKQFLRISPVQNADDCNRLEAMINEIQHEKMVQNLKSLFQDLSDEERFYGCPSGVTDRDSALDCMIEPLKKKGIVQDDFRQLILERDDMITSGIDLIDILRAPEYDAQSDTMSLMILDAPVNWGEREIQAVLLITSRKTDYQPVCMKVLRRLFHVMARHGMTKKVLQCRSFAEFNRLFA